MESGQCIQHNLSILLCLYIRQFIHYNILKQMMIFYTFPDFFIMIQTVFDFISNCFALFFIINLLYLIKEKDKIKQEQKNRQNQTRKKRAKSNKNKKEAKSNQKKKKGFLQLILASLCLVVWLII